MKRAAVLIGVDKTGDLPKLGDAAAGAQRMAAWARAQGIDSVVTFTDEGGKPVLAHEISKAIREIVSKGADQLLVYFAGHGVNVGYAERWLLSDAPHDANAAVNLNGSADRAHNCGIGHVVFMSDACRTAAEGIGAQGVDGSIIFPNERAPGPERPVDRFWACLVGDPALEVRDPKASSRGYKALYTGAVLDALQGEEPDVIEKDGTGNFVRPWPLKQWLHTEMAQRLSDLDLGPEAIQEPDARITSDKGAWIARFMAAPGLRAPRAPAPPGPGKRSQKFMTRRVRGPVENLESISNELVRSAISGGETLRRGMEVARAATLRGGRSLAESAQRTSQPFGPSHFETGCGFKLRGSKFVGATAKRAKAHVLGSDAVRVEQVQKPGASVLLTFADHSAAVVPALPGFIAALTVENGALVDVAYEPSDNSGWRWDEFKKRADEIRALRGIAASSTRRGLFRLDSENALATARTMQYAKGVDPALAVYAAYAYLDLQRRDRIREMAKYMVEDLGARLFDIAMLAQELDNKAVNAGSGVLPFLPLLAQGWALFPAYGIKLPPALDGIQRMQRPSVWTLFNEEGAKRLESVINSAEVL